MSSQKLQTLKGFRDFYPEDMAFQSWLYKNIKEVSESFGFQEYEGPILEPLDLYAAKSGEELVKKQAFTLKDKSNKLLALRPEMTPTLARMVAKKEGSLTFPIKWFTYGRRFRYETPQKGRGREFFQWDIDILGSENPLTDAEIIQIAATFYKKVGLTPSMVKIKINDRVFLQEKLASLGILKEKTFSIFKTIDKKNKVNAKEFEEMLNDSDLSKIQTDKLLSLLADKNSYKDSPWLVEIMKAVEKMGVSEYVEFDSTIVRGLDYYTRTVLEGWDIKGVFRSIWGGGRYDNLTMAVGGKTKIPGVGFAMGDMVLKELLITNNKYPKLQISKTQVLVTVFNSDLLSKSIDVSRKLRGSGINTEIYPEDSIRLDKQLKYADKKGIPYVVIIGPEEIETKTITLKNLKTKEQTKTSFENLVSLVK